MKNKNEYIYYFLIVISQGSVIPKLWMEKWTLRLAKSVSSLFWSFSIWLEFTVPLQEKYVQ